MHLCSIYKGEMNMYDAFKINDTERISMYGAFMHKDSIDEQERKNLKVWIRNVMTSQKMSAYEWATKAGTSPTNITRFINSDSKYIPSTRTVAKLAKVAGSQPHTVGQAPGNTRTLEVFDYEGNRMRYVNVYNVKGKVAAYELSYSEQVRNNVTGYYQGGIAIGDTILVRPDHKYADGDALLFRNDETLPNEFADYPALLVGQVVGKHIVFRTSAPMKPILLDSVEKLGKVIQCIKSFV